jgi:hypothetical protein
VAYVNFIAFNNLFYDAASTCNSTQTLHLELHTFDSGLWGEGEERATRSGQCTKVIQAATVSESSQYER